MLVYAESFATDKTLSEREFNHLLQDLRSAEKPKINLHATVFTKEQFILFFRALSQSGTLVQLVLTNCSMTNYHLRLLADALLSNTGLESVDLENNSIDDHSESILIELFKNNHVLININLKGNLVTPKLLASIQPWIARNREIQYEMKRKNTYQAVAEVVSAAGLPKELAKNILFEYINESTLKDAREYLVEDLYEPVLLWSYPKTLPETPVAATNGKKHTPTITHNASRFCIVS